MDAASEDPRPPDQAEEWPVESRADAWARRGLMCAVLFPPAGLVIGIVLRLSGDRRGWRVLRWTGTMYFFIFVFIFVMSSAEAGAFA